mmetsp:Transcript_9176/g.27560  ORF Transcript_9176/g.27560 Transcript_9176/m.27560 type:complete len:258 (-) Transcript_9176:7-780(-)
MSKTQVLETSYAQFCSIIPVDQCRSMKRPATATLTCSVLLFCLCAWGPALFRSRGQEAYGGSLPFSEETKGVPSRCGTWQRQYATFHKRTLRGELQPRYVVSVAVQAGLADRLVGTIQTFFYAIITKRAFQITTYDSIPGLELAFDPTRSQINWLRAPIEEEIIGPLKFSRQQELGLQDGEYHPVIDVKYKTKWAYMYLINDMAKSAEIFGGSNLLYEPAGYHESETVLVASNRGQVLKLFDNPNHRCVCTAAPLCV